MNYHGTAVASELRSLPETACSHPAKLDHRDIQYGLLWLQISESTFNL